MNTKPKLGAPKTGNVKLTCHVPPDVRAVLGDQPGKAITELVRSTQPSR